MRRRNFYTTSRYKRITQSRPKEYAEYEETRRKEFVNKWNLPFQQKKVKINEIEKIHKYLALVRRLKKLRNMRATMIVTGKGALGTVYKGLEKDWTN